MMKAIAYNPTVYGTVFTRKWTHVADSHAMQARLVSKPESGPSLL